MRLAERPSNGREENGHASLSEPAHRWSRRRDDRLHLRPRACARRPSDRYAALAARPRLLRGLRLLRSPEPPGSPAPQSYQTEAPPPPAGSDVSSEAVFYERLSPYGYWMFVAPYGRVWVPAVGYGWRPYYYGQWVLTDWGWTFVSDDPWGWAAYHYGRWNWGMGIGWGWVPGPGWGPAWGRLRGWGGGAGLVPARPPGGLFWPP